MNNNNDEGSLEFINRLLERLHQADYKVLGSIVLNIYEQGSQHVETQINIGETRPHPLPKGRGVDTFKTEESNLSALPNVLRTEAAMVLWKKAQDAGYVDDDYQPLISRTQSALLADAMAERLGIREKWKVFEALWNRKNMRGDYNDALNQRQTFGFRDKLKIIFTD